MTRTEPRGARGLCDLEKLVAAGVAEDLGPAADALVLRLTAITAVAGLREIYATSDASICPGMAELIPLVHRVLDFARACTATQPIRAATDRVS